LHACSPTDISTQADAVKQARKAESPCPLMQLLMQARLSAPIVLRRSCTC
jgi:hypothetical protein